MPWTDGFQYMDFDEQAVADEQDMTAVGAMGNVMAKPLREISCPISGEIIQQNHGIGGSSSNFLSCFEEIEPLGKGGFGSVVKCRHKIDGVIYVVKKIEIRQTGMSFEKTKREVEILGKVNHPNVIRYYSCWVEEHICGYYYDSDGHLCKHKAESPCFYIQMEFCPNKLSSYLLIAEMDMARRLAFIRQLVDAVSYIHSLGIIHRDLSCENILLDEQFNIKIIDFGQAVMGEMEHFQSNPHGAHYYMAPELKKGKQIDCKVDIFSLGVLFFEILKSWRTESERILHMDDLKHLGLRSLQLNNLGAHEWLIKDMLNNNPRQRPSASLIQDMTPWMDDFEYMGIDEQAMADECMNDGLE